MIKKINWINWKKRYRTIRGGEKLDKNWKRYKWNRKKNDIEWYDYLRKWKYKSYNEIILWKIRDE